MTEVTIPEQDSNSNNLEHWLAESLALMNRGVNSLDAEFQRVQKFTGEESYSRSGCLEFPRDFSQDFKFFLDQVKSQLSYLHNGRSLDLKISMINGIYDATVSIERMKIHLSQILEKANDELVLSQSSPSQVQEKQESPAERLREKYQELQRSIDTARFLQIGILQTSIDDISESVTQSRLERCQEIYGVGNSSERSMAFGLHSLFGRDYRKALDAFLSVQKNFSEESKTKDGIVQYLIGTSYFILGDFDNAEMYLKSLYDKNNDESSLALLVLCHVYLGKAELFLKLKSDKEAVESCALARQCYDDFCNPGRRSDDILERLENIEYYFEDHPEMQLSRIGTNTEMEGR